jgi:hypothetical protein
MSLKIKWFKTVLMPAQHILKKLDPENQRSVEVVTSDPKPLQDQYVNLCVRNHPNLVPGIDIKEALKIYKSFHLLKKASTWGDDPFSVLAVNASRTVSALTACSSLPCSVRSVDGSEPMQNDQAYFFSDIFLNFIIF